MLYTWNRGAPDNCSKFSISGINFCFQSSEAVFQDIFTSLNLDVLFRKMEGSWCSFVTSCKKATNKMKSSNTPWNTFFAWNLGLCKCQMMTANSKVCIIYRADTFSSFSTTCKCTWLMARESYAHHGYPVVSSLLEAQPIDTNSDKNVRSIFQELDWDQSQYLAYRFHSQHQQWQLSRRTFHQLSQTACPAHLQCSSGSVFSLPQHPQLPQTFRMEIWMQAATFADFECEVNSIVGSFWAHVAILWHGWSL